MKFAALALALLLAVGSRAASMQADAPSQLQHIRTAADMYIVQVKESAKKALDGLDGTEYGGLKATLIQRVDDLHENLKAFQQTVSPMTDSVFTTVDAATTEFRTNLMNDFEALKADVKPKVDNLKVVLERHFEDYRAKAEPIIKEYMDKHTTEMEALKTKMEPVVEELRAKVATNVEETKEALIPIVNSVRTKLSAQLENLKLYVTPYVEEYKEQLKEAYQNAQGVSVDELTTLKDKVSPLAGEIKEKLQVIAEAVMTTFSKN